MPAIYNSKTDKAMLELPGLQITDLDCSGQDLSFGKFTSSTIAATLTWYLVIACIVVAAPTIEDLIGVSKGVFQLAALMMPALAGPSRQSTYKASLKVLNCAFLVFIPIIAIEYALLKFKVALPTGPLWIVCCSVVTLCATLGFNHIYLRECRQVKDYFQFERINFTGAKLTYTDWNRSSVKHTTFNHADLSYARFENTGIFNCNLSSCKLANLKALKSNLQECLIADAVLTSAAFRRSFIQSCKSLRRRLFVIEIHYLRFHVGHCG